MSHRFSKLLHTDSVVLKETSGWEEYFYAALKPWVHYVPVRSSVGADALANRPTNNSDHSRRAVRADLVGLMADAPSGWRAARENRLRF